MKKHEEKCSHCNGTGKIQLMIFYPVSKLIKIMKKHKLSQLKLSKIIGVSQAAISNWVKPRSPNVNGVKKKYFDVLEAKGFK